MPALPGVQTYLAGVGCNEEGQVGDFICFQINRFHDVNSLFIDS